MPDRLAQLKDKLASGLHPSLPSYQKPFWDVGANVLFQDQSIQPEPGQVAIFAKPSNLPVVGVLETVVSGAKWLFFGNRQALYSWKEGDAAPTVATRASGAYTGTDLDLWSIRPWGNGVLATNGVDTPQYWLAPGPFVDLSSVAGTDYPSSGRASVAKENGPFMMLFATDVDKRQFEWSAEDDITTWTPTVSNLAGDDIIRDLQSDIIAVEDLGNVLA